MMLNGLFCNTCVNLFFHSGASTSHIIIFVCATYTTLIPTEFENRKNFFSTP
ncbi:unnamed protein product, partial [Trichogramma brassicae]